MATASSPLITSLPLTAEAREKLLLDLFADELPHLGELFVPGHSFYVHGTSHAQARHMLIDLCAWLGIKPGYIGLVFESHPEHTREGQRYSIFLESRVLWDELLLGATLAHALVRYLLEERKQIHLMDPHEQLSLVATGTVAFGLGIVTANGLRPDKASAKARRELLGQMPIGEYIAVLRGFMWQRAIAVHAYENSLAPWIAAQLGLKKPKKPIAIVRQQYHYVRQKRLEKIGIIWLLLLVVGVGSFVFFQRAKPHSIEYRELQEKITLLTNLKQQCNNAVSYARQYTDTSDLQHQRAIRAEELRCESLDNQLRSAQTELIKFE